MKKVAILLLGIATLSLAAEDARVQFPAEYRESFVEYLSLDRTQNPDQVIRLFANTVAMQGADENGELAGGSVLVAEVYAARKDAEGNVVESDLGRRIAEELLLVAVMEKQDDWQASSASSISVGDWDFGAFRPSGEVAGSNLDSCRACHAPLRTTDFLFSLDHLPTR